MKRSLVAIVFLLLTVCSLSAQITYEVHPKDPAKAMLYGIIVPGLGQAYNGQIGSAALVMISIPALYGLSVVLNDKNPESNAYLAPIVVAGVVYLFSIFDAGNQADKWNRKKFGMNYNSVILANHKRGNAVVLSYNF